MGETRPRPTARTLAREFRRGLTMIGLARKHGMPMREVEARIQIIAALGPARRVARRA